MCILHVNFMFIHSSFSSYPQYDRVPITVNSLHFNSYNYSLSSAPLKCAWQEDAAFYFFFFQQILTSFGYISLKVTSFFLIFPVYSLLGHSVVFFAEDQKKPQVHFFLRLDEARLSLLTLVRLKLVK